MAVLGGFLRGNGKGWMAGKPRGAGLGGWWGRGEKGARIMDHGAINRFYIVDVLKKK
jgi:hypothetical protein